jgi:hypothetical protein
LKLSEEVAIHNQFRVSQKPKAAVTLLAKYGHLKRILMILAYAMDKKKSRLYQKINMHLAHKNQLQSLEKGEDNK